MKIEQLVMDNLRDGVFCGKGNPLADEWYEQLEAWLDGGLLRGQIARDDDGEAVGFVLYYPIEKAPMEVGGDGLYMVQCLQVKPKHNKTEIAKALIKSAASDAQISGAAGIIAEGMREEEPLHEHVTAAFLENLGMSKGQSRGFATLYYIVFNNETDEPKYLPARFNPPVSKSTLRIDILDCGLCYVGIHNRETVKQAVERSESRNIEVVVHNQSTREAVVDKGFSNGIFIDGKLTFFRGPISEADVTNAIDVANSARRRSTDK